MTFDARSKERLEALGRTLPKKLPLPESAPPPQATDPRSVAPGAGLQAPVPTGSTSRRPGSLVQRPQQPGSQSPRVQATGAQATGTQGTGIQGSKDKRGPRETARHRLEREQDPAELFRALISASADGTVPPHLLDRLRELEAPPLPSSALATGQAAATLSGPLAQRSSNNRSTPSPRTPGKGAKGSASAANRLGSRNPGQGRASDDQDLYTAFAQLLLEDDGD